MNPDPQTPPLGATQAQGALARAFRGHKHALQGALLRTPGGVEALDPTGGWGVGLPAPGASLQERRAFLARVRAAGFTSLQLDEAARSLMPSLPPATAGALGRQCRQMLASRGALLESARPWVEGFAKSTAHKWGRGLDRELIDELQQAGHLALCGGILERFDPAVASLSTYSYHALEDAFLQVRNLYKVFKVHKQDIKAWKALDRMQQELSQAHGRRVGPEEAGRALGWPSAKVQDTLQKLTGSLCVEALWGPGTEEGASSDHPALAYDDPEVQEVGARLLAADLDKSLDQLDPLHRKVFLEVATRSDAAWKQEGVFRRLGSELRLPPRQVEAHYHQAVGRLKGSLSLSGEASTAPRRGAA